MLRIRYVLLLAAAAAVLANAPGAAAAVNLTPYQPTGWSSKVVISTTTGTSTDSSPLTSSNTLYIDWAVLNNGTTATAGTFYTYLLVDGVTYASWYTDPPLNSNYYTYVTDYALGTLSAGTHTITLRTDATGAIAESSETDNEFSRTITISGSTPNLAPYAPAGWSDKIVISKTSGTTTDGSSLTTSDPLYIDWAVVNNGSVPTAARFYTSLYLDGVFLTSWYSDPPVGANSYVYVADYVIGPLSAGTHTLSITADSTGAIGETNESDNSYTRTFSVSTPGTPNLTPYQPSGWSDKVVLAKTTGTTTDGSGFTTADTIYVDWAVLNNGNAATGVRFYTDLQVDGVTLVSFYSDPPVSSSNYVYYLDYSLGPLSAGTHTVTIRTDSTGAIAESSESDNTYSKTITIGTVSQPNLTPYQPAGWSDRIVVSKVTGTNTDSSPLAATDALYVDWAVINSGNAATAVRFYTELLIDGSVRASWYTDPPMNQATYVYVPDASIGSLSSGTHTITIRTDSTSVIDEPNEGDNSYTKTITIGGGSALYKGPASGTSNAGQSVSTTSFSNFLMPLQSMSRMAEPDPPIPLVQNPPHDVVRIPLRSNEVDDRPARVTVPSFIEMSASLGASFVGFSNTGWIPPDPDLAAGPNHLVATVNNTFSIFTKAGSRLAQINLDSWFGNVLPSLGSSEFVFDPKVVYDQGSGRWILAGIATNGSSESWHLLSVSDDSDPNGTWCNYAARGDRNGGSVVSNWSDYDMIGVNDDAVYFSTNQFAFGGGFAYAKVRVIPKTQLYSAQCPAFPFNDLWDLRAPTDPATPVASVQPAVSYGSAPAEFLISDSTAFTSNYVTLWLLRNPTTAPALEPTDVTVTSTLEPVNANQLNAPGNTDCPAPCRLNAGDRRFRNAVYRNGSLWAAHAVAGGSNNAYTRSRYVKIATSPAASAEDRAFGVDNCWYFYPVVATDGSSNLVMAYSKSCISEYAGIGFTTRATSDGDLQPETSVKAGESSYMALDTQKRNRWGDYGGAAADPSDPSKVWIHNEYAAATANTWATRIASVSFSGGGCTSPSITAQPSSVTITSGQSTTLSVAASGTPTLTYQWYTGTSGDTSSPVNGGTGSSVNVSPGSTTNYWVRVTNGCGFANSVTATVTVKPLCTSFSIAPTSINVGAPAGSQPIAVAGAPTGCQGGTWTAAGNGSWITVAPTGGSGSQPVTVSWTQSGTPRSGTATVAGSTLTVNQSGTLSGFYLLTPCRLIDSRNPDGPYGGPALASPTVRNFVVTGQCGIPSGVTALSLNLAVVAPALDGWMVAYPGPIGSVRPAVSSINYKSGKTIANNAIVPVGADGSINIYNNVTNPTHFVIDVNGYFK